MATAGSAAPGITLACVGVAVVSVVTLLAREEVAAADVRSTAIGIGLTLIAMVRPGRGAPCSMYTPAPQQGNKLAQKGARGQRADCLLRVRMP